MIANAPEFRARVGRALAARFPEDPAAPAPPVEKQIYGGFYSNADKALLKEFQRADWPQRQEIVATFTDLRLRQLGCRLVAFYSPELLSPEERELYDAWLRDRWAAPHVPETEWTTLENARHALDEMQADPQQDRSTLGEIQVYLNRFDQPAG